MGFIINLIMDELICKYLSGSLDEDAQRKFLAWLDADKSNQKRFLQLYRIWITAQYDQDAIDPAEVFENLRYKLNVRQRRKIYLKRLYVAICVTAGMAIAFLGIKIFQPTDDIVRFANQNTAENSTATETKLILSDNKVVLIDEDEASISYNQNSIQTDKNKTVPISESAKFNRLIVPYGKRISVSFSDGTKFWANAGTNLVYPANFSCKKREIFVDGEVYLEVSHDKSRPFIVKTRNMEVEVLGTKFGITDYNADKDKRVVLVSGAVKVNNLSSDKSFMLKPSQMYANNGSVESVDTVDAGRYISWINGNYIFEMEPLGNVLFRLSRFYNVEMECDEKAAGYRCSGTLHFEMDLDAILTGITYSIPVSYIKSGEKYQILSME